MQLLALLKNLMDKAIEIDAYFGETTKPSVLMDILSVYDKESIYNKLNGSVTRFVDVAETLHTLTYSNANNFYIFEYETDNSLDTWKTLCGKADLQALPSEIKFITWFGSFKCYKLPKYTIHNSRCLSKPKNSKALAMKDLLYNGGFYGDKKGLLLAFPEIPKVVNTLCALRDNYEIDFYITPEYFDKGWGFDEDGDVVMFNSLLGGRLS